MLLLFILCSGTLFANELSFEALADAAYPREVTLRGFLYRTQAGDLVLAAEPNLKSCCVGAQHQVKRQIIVEGNMDDPKAGQVYVLQGILTVDPITSSYLLRESYQIQSQVDITRYATYISLMVLIIGLCLAYLRK